MSPSRTELEPEAASARHETRNRATKPDWAGAGARRGDSESESYRAGAYQAHARGTWIGAEPNEGHSRTGRL